ncbi:transmembrane amino acid transporter protein-domain-containing protein [Hyaloraphidium curvatum]|nr:transmembrane amino acid transporter protein-domain-containing protein [Hyaloraphidium curvatum]
MADTADGGPPVAPPAFPSEKRAAAPQKSDAAALPAADPAALPVRPRADAVVPQGGRLKAAGLILTTTTLPTLLALPTAMAGLGWAAGVVVLLGAALAAFYCFYSLVALNDYGGSPHYTYPELTDAVLGRRWYTGSMVLALQYASQWGTGVANLVMAGGLLQHFWKANCAPASCSAMNTAWWTAVCGAAMAVLGQLPDFSNRNWAIITSGFFTVFYSTVAIGLSIANNQAATANYSMEGTTVQNMFTAFNAIGMVLFVYGDTMYAEEQSMLTPVDGSTVGPMHGGMKIAFGITVPLLATLACVGFWAYGTAVTPFLFNASMNPAWLAILASATCVLQLLFGNAVFEQPIVEKIETKMAARWPAQGWMRHAVDDAAYPSRWLMFLVRTGYCLSVTVVAVFFPFFSSLMGLIGAAVLTPLTFVYPMAMKIRAGGPGAGRWVRALDTAIVVVFGLAGCVAAVGAVQGIVVGLQNLDLSA